MFDINLIREKPELVKEALIKRQMDPSPIDVILELDARRRSKLAEVENLKAERNAVSKEISKMKDQAERQAKIESTRLLGDKISDLDVELKQVEADLNDLVAVIPNMPSDRVPYGKDDKDNPVVKVFSELPTFAVHTQTALGPGSRVGYHRL